VFLLLFCYALQTIDLTVSFQGASVLDAPTTLDLLPIVQGVEDAVVIVFGYVFGVSSAGPLHENETATFSFCPQLAFLCPLLLPSCVQQWNDSRQ
jgi:hypothetical protein